MHETIISCFGKGYIYSEALFQKGSTGTTCAVVTYQTTFVFMTDSKFEGQ